MSDVSVRALGGDDWQTYREVRLAALRDAPEAFTSSYAQEVDFEESFWRTRMGRSTRLLATQDDGTAVGIASVGHAGAADVAELFGIWVAPALRGGGVAWRLTEAASDHAKANGQRALQAWVSTDNGRAVAFFSSYGFRPGDQRRPTATDPDVAELVMTLPLGDDPGWVPTTEL